MREAFYSAEPTLGRMLFRFALVIGLLVLSALVAVLLQLNTANPVVLMGLAGVPALCVPVIEKMGQARRLGRMKRADELDVMEPLRSEWPALEHGEVHHEDATAEPPETRQTLRLVADLMNTWSELDLQTMKDMDLLIQELKDVDLLTLHNRTQFIKARLQWRTELMKALRDRITSDITGVK